MALTGTPSGPSSPTRAPRNYTDARSHRASAPARPAYGRARAGGCLQCGSRRGPSQGGTCAGRGSGGWGRGDWDTCREGVPFPSFLGSVLGGEAQLLHVHSCTAQTGTPSVTPAHSLSLPSAPWHPTPCSSSLQTPPTRSPACIQHLLPTLLPPVSAPLPAALRAAQTEGPAKWSSVNVRLPSGTEGFRNLPVTPEAGTVVIGRGPGHCRGCWWPLVCHSAGTTCLSPSRHYSAGW